MNVVRPIEKYNELRERLAFYADDEYRDFSMRGIPSERPFIGVRIPKIRELAGLVPEEKIEEFYNSDFVSNTRNTINTARSLGKKLVKTTTTTIKREESINV